MKNKLDIIIFVVIMMSLPFIVFSFPLPSTIAQDAGMIHVTYYAVISTCAIISILVAYVRILKK